jgi:hypothetical protein
LKFGAEIGTGVVQNERDRAEILAPLFRILLQFPLDLFLDCPLDRRADHFADDVVAALRRIRGTSGLRSRDRANRTAGCRARLLFAGPDARLRPPPSFPFRGVWFSGNWRENNKRLQRKGNSMNLIELISYEHLIAAVTLFTIAGILLAEPPSVPLELNEPDSVTSPAISDQAQLRRVHLATNIVILVSSYLYVAIVATALVLWIALR